MASLIILLFLGTLITLCGLGTCIKPLALLMRGRRVLGTIVDVREDQLRYSTAYWITASFTTPDGRSWRVHSAGDPDATIGDRVSVLYNPTRPSMAEVRSMRSLWTVPGYLLGFGALCLGVAVIGMHAGGV
jgi:hypothetical protein